MSSIENQGRSRRRAGIVVRVVAAAAIVVGVAAVTASAQSADEAPPADTDDAVTADEPTPDDGTVTEDTAAPDTVPDTEPQAEATATTDDDVAPDDELPVEDTVPTTTTPTVVEPSPTSDAPATNATPVAGDDFYRTAMNTTLIVGPPGLLSNDRDPDDELVALDPTTPANGTVNTEPDGSFTYDPRSGFVGTDRFSYDSCEGPANDPYQCVTATVTITVFDPGPDAVDDDYATLEDTDLEVGASGVLGNDHFSGIYGGEVSLVESPTHGTLLNLGQDGSFEYRPTGDYFGPDFFTYRICDDELNGGGDDVGGEQRCDDATVDIEVEPVNDPPEAANDTYHTPEDTDLAVPPSGVLINDHDVDADALAATTFSQPSHGTVVGPIDGSFSYMPEADYFGPDEFTYQVCEVATTERYCYTATITIEVEPVNDPPVAADDSYTTPEDTTLIVPAPGVLGGDNDVERDALAAITFSRPSHGTVVGPIDGSFSYMPEADYFGPDAFTYDVCEVATTERYCYTATITIEVEPVNDRPVANDDSYTTSEDVRLDIPAAGVLANDTDVERDPLFVSGVPIATSGAVGILADGSFAYQPDPGFVGEDSFVYRACDAEACDDATVTITVVEVTEPITTPPTTRPDRMPETGDEDPDYDVPDDVEDPDDGETAEVPNVADPPDEADAEVDRPVPTDTTADRDGDDARTDAAEFSVTPDVVMVGDQLMASARGCRADGPIDLTVGSTVVGEVTPVDGAFRAELDVSQLEPGRHTLVAHCSNELRASFDVALTTSVPTGAGTVLSLATFSLALLGLTWRPLGRML